jgi:N-acetylglutamate synthase-like GNAT family acetyltransferase
MPVVIHPAIADDQYAITAIVRAARINRSNLDWQRFLVARWGQDIIGVGQVKPHGDGSRELASIAVIPEWQGQGVGSAIIRALLARESGVLYLMCALPTQRYYERFGFQRIERRDMPPYFRRLDWFARIITRLSFGRIGVAVMRNERLTIKG